MDGDKKKRERLEKKMRGNKAALVVTPLLFGLVILLTYLILEYPSYMISLLLPMGFGALFFVLGLAVLVFIDDRIWKEGDEKESDE